jgi:molybdopterin converting factor small subunit
MGTRISLKTCFALPDSASEGMPLPEGVETVGDLINHIGGQIEYSFMDPESGHLEEDLEIIVNKKEIWFYPDALNTPLQDGDVVEVYLLPLGGG